MTPFVKIRLFVPTKIFSHYASFVAFALLINLDVALDLISPSSTFSWVNRLVSSVVLGTVTVTASKIDACGFVTVCFWGVFFQALGEIIIDNAKYSLCSLVFMFAEQTEKASD